MKSFSKLMVIFLLTGSHLSYAQFKKIAFDPQIKVENKDLILAQKENITVANEYNFSDVVFSSLDNATLNGLNSELKPGIINERKVPAYIEGQLKSTGKRGFTTENLTFEYLDAAAPLMQIKQPSQEFKIQSIEIDALDITHVRLIQLVKGLPVYGAEIIIHGEGQNFDFLNGTYYPTIEIENITPIYQKQQTLSIAEDDLGGAVTYENEISRVGDLTPTSNLVIYPYNDKFLLAYHITIYKNLIDRWEYFIDANTGEVINKYTSICKFHNHKHGQGEQCKEILNDHILPTESAFLDGKATATAQDLFNINRLINTYEVASKYYMIDGSRDIFASAPNKLPNDPEGVIWTIDAFNTSPAKDNFRYDHVTSNNNVWSNKTSVSAHYNGGKAFEYFRTIHNRKSINGSGGNIISLINVAEDDGSSMGNAFWNGQAMFYGNGDGAFLPLARGLDVAGHEMTHGVIQSTANLEYQGESGALNESFADVFGAMIDRDDWKIGEDVVKSAAFPSGALRDLENPHNGASTNNFNAGWQPRHYNERYKGNEDNGGVHINSGIPNWAFFKFATAVGKDKAEKVYFRALSNYLTKSSKFVDCRIAVIKAAADLFGTTEINAAKKAFDEVGILGETGGNYETDLNTNPGQEFVLTTGANNSGLFIYNTSGVNLGQISTKSILSKPSISDDGSEIVFVGTDNKMYYLQIDWSKNPATLQEQTLSNEPIWRNVIISKDGLKIAALTKEEINDVYVYYFGGANVTQSRFELYNPTYTQGITTGDVNYADAMEFDITGEYIMYDAENEIKSNNAGSIIYWDISFIKVWNNASNTFALGQVDKLYASLPDDISIGNPTFSKNSPYIIAFDYIDENGDVNILGGNIESGKVSLIYENNTLGYPNYSSKDDKLVFDFEGSTALNLGVTTLKSNKIEPAANPTTFVNSRRWAVWFSNGKRSLSNIAFDKNLNAGFTIVENPTANVLRLNINSSTYHKNTSLKVTDLSGKVVVVQDFNNTGQNDSIEVNINDLNAGMYFVTLQCGEAINTLGFVKN